LELPVSSDDSTTQGESTVGSSWSVATAAVAGAVVVVVVVVVVVSVAGAV
jgi:hypothetical protein